MRRINLLLASAERRSSNALEAMVLDVCYDQAVVESTRTARVDELVYFGCRDGHQLIVVVVDHLLAEPSRRGVPVTIEEALRAIRLIRSERSTPIVAVAAATTDEQSLVEAGADYVITGLPSNPDTIKSQLRRMLNMPELAEAEPPSRWSLGAWLRGDTRLKNA